MPLQLSSRRLHFSGVGPTSPAHCSVPPTQIVWPNEHSPVSVAPHGWPTSVGLLSTTPLQSSSRPLQISGPPPVAPTHTSVPPWQAYVPCVHTPTELPHGPPPPGLPSSVLPSQSSSL